MAALDGPLDAYDGGVDSEALGDLDDDGVFDGCGVVGCFVAVGACGGADGAEAYGDDFVVAGVVEEFGLLEMGVEFHFDAGGLGFGVADEEAHLGTANSFMYHAANQT